MKKVMLVLVVLLVACSFAFALESGPSNKVGYVKILCTGTLNQTASTPFGLPFKFWNVPVGGVPTYGVESTFPSSIIGTQANCGGLATADKIQRQDNGAQGYRYTVAGCAWRGSLENDGTMSPGRFYWYQNKTGVNRNLVLAGEADTTAVGIPTVTITAPTPPATVSSTSYSWRDPRAIPRDKLNLNPGVDFRGGGIGTSDKITDQQSGTNIWYDAVHSVWMGSMAAVTPGMACWFQNKHAGHPWNYTYTAAGTPILMPGGRTELQKISASSAAPKINTTKSGVPAATKN